MELLDRRDFVKMSARSVGALGLLAAGCGGASSSTSPQITMWVDSLPDPLAHWNASYVLPAFKKSHPNASVQLINKGPDEPQALQTALAAGGGPTIVYEDPTYLYGFEKAGYLVPLDEYAAQYGWKEKFLPWALSTGTFKGTLYTVPERLESMIMYYSPPALAKHGWTVPQNYEELVALCKEATAAGIIPMAGGSADWHPATEWWLTSWWNAYAGPRLFYEALTGKARFTDAAFVDAVANLKYFFDKGWIAGGSSKFFATQSAVAQSQIANGQAALGPVGTWSFSTASTYFSSSFDWSWAPVPPLSAEVTEPVYPLSVGALVGINRRAGKAEQAAAAAFIDLYEADPVVSGDGLANAGRELGSVEIAATDFPSNTPKQMSSFYEELAKQSGRGAFGFATWTFLPAATDTYLYTALENVITGSLSPQEYCRGIQSRFDRDIAAGNVPPPAPKPTAFL